MVDTTDFQQDRADRQGWAPSVDKFGPITLGVLVIISGWFIYHYLEPFRLIRRRAILRELYFQKSWPRRLFWRGELLRVVLGVKALALGALAIVLLAGMTFHERVALLVGLPILALITALSWWRLNSQIVPEYRFATALRFGYWISFALVLGGMTWWAIVFGEVASTSELGLLEVAQQSYALESAAATWEPFGFLLGLNAALSSGSWHLLQVIDSHEAWGSALYLTACALILGWVALKLAVIWLIPLGIASAVYRQKQNGWRILGDGDLSRGFTISLGVIFVFYLLATQINIPHLLNGNSVYQANHEPASRTCEAVERERQVILAEEATAWGNEQRLSFERRIRDVVSTQLDAAFAQTEEGVEAFLDWNYSLTGQYQQLMYMGVSAAGSKNFEEFIGGKVDEYVHDTLSIALVSMSDTLERELSSEIDRLWEAKDGFINKRIGDGYCFAPPNPSFALTDYVEKSLVGAGSGAAILSARVSTSTGARVVGRQAISRFLGVFGAKLAARAPYVLIASAAGKVCGPGVAVCAPLLGAITWVVTDILINLGDEALNRDDMREEMMLALQDDRDELEKKLINSYLAMSSGIFRNIEVYQGERFNPYRDGR